MNQRHRLRSRQRIPLLVLVGTLIGAPLAFAAEQKKEEEMIVTGSYIKGTPEDAALPVQVLTRQDLVDVGSPSIIEMTRNLNVTSGNDSETNQFDGRNAGSGVATINLRGLGASRTLVMINGRRQVPTETSGVDIASMPTSAIGRIEVLKDGAAALYGSDAIGGVVNLITRDNFEGIELRGTQQFIQDSDGDQDVSALFGWGRDALYGMLALEYSRRDELPARERDWAVRPIAFSSQGGFSSIGNPGTIFPANAAGQIVAGGLADPNCTQLGGQKTTPTSGCFFQYTFFDNLIEAQDHYKAFAAADYDINDSMSLHVEGLAAYMNQDAWKTSPSYPPQSLFGPDRLIAANHPGLVDLRAQNPTLAGLGAPGTPVYSLSRYLGTAGFFGQPQQGKRDTYTYRFGGGLTGTFGEVNYDLAVNWSKRQRETNGSDMFVERMAFALDGLGGPNCNPASGTPGVGGCEYYNPFSNAIQRSVVNGFVNPQFNPAVANSADMTRWLVGPYETKATNDVLVFDAVFSGELPWALDGGAIGWAGGYQARNEHYQLELNDEVNVALNPCQFNNPFSITIGNTTSLNCTSRTGPYAFISGTTEEKTGRIIHAWFGELALPVTDKIDVQAAIRFEDYGGQVGSSLDPKIAVRWQPIEWLALRGSASSTFRGPPQSLLSGRATSLNFIGPTNAFKAVDLIGNPNLSPEKAIATNVGVIVDVGPFYGSIDYWSFDFTDPLQSESFSQIVSAYLPQTATNPAGLDCRDGGIGAPLVGGTVTPSTACAAIRAHVFPTGTAGAGIQRIDTNFINGPDLTVSGLDGFVQYDIDVMDGAQLSLGAEATYNLEFESKDFLDINGAKLASGRDFVGFLNDGQPFRSMPQLKGNMFARFVMGTHRVTYTLRYVDDYEDNTGPANANLAKIDSQVTHDLSYNVSLLNDAATLSLTVLNLTDKDPPPASLDLNYDPFTHNPFGRMIKLGVTYNVGNVFE